MRLKPILLFFLNVLLLSACGSTCPPDTIGYLNPPYPPEIIDQSTQPQLVEIEGEDIMVDEIITGTVCNDTWDGTVYLTCDIQIPAWEKDAFFFQDCALEISESSVVYVEAHRNEPYYEGCSCHE